MRIRRGWALAELWLAWMMVFGAVARLDVAAMAQSVPAIATTTLTGQVFHADGTPATGTVLISWPAFSTWAGNSVPSGSTSVTLSSTGALSVQLVANAASTPMGSYYTAIYHLDDGSVTTEYWVVPVSTVPVQVSAIKSSVLPASVAMQTVSKAYVDTAIAAAVGGHPLDSSPYVLKAGDSMTGPLNLPADPVSPSQAADMNYVDEQVAGVSAGLNQKVSTLPAAGQVVAQPPGTQLAVNNLNGKLDASQYVTGSGNNGIANATASANCTAGCDVEVEQGYPATEQVTPGQWNNQTHVEDHRGGSTTESVENPLLPGGIDAGRTISVYNTQSTPSAVAASGSGNIFNEGLVINSNALAGGSNVYPADLQGTVPYFKTTYGALSMTGTNNTIGQHDLAGFVQNCYAVGDCQLGGEYILASGGFRDDADEGAHPFDRLFSEDPRVFTGTCSQGCTTGATSLQIAVTANPGTQGEGRYLLDVNPALAITTGSIVGQGPYGGLLPSAVFSGTSFPVSTFLQTAQTIPTQSNNIAPGTVTIPIATSAVPAGFATNTAALPASTGVACVAGSQYTDFETAAYTVVDGSHLQLTLNRPHANGATIAVGGLCGYGLEQKVDTINGIRQVFPVVGSSSPTSLYYEGGITAIVGVQGTTSGFVNTSLVVASISRNANVVTVTTVVNLPIDLNGLAVTVANVADSSYNGTFTVTTTGPNSFTYQSSGANSASAGGNASFVTGAFGLYPMAEVVGVYNASTKAVDGAITLAANTVPWSSGDAVEMPHYFQERVTTDTDMVTQYTPRATRNEGAGVQWLGNNGAGLKGWQIINSDPVTSYFSNGGTHSAPDDGLSIQGVWSNAVETQAGEQSVFDVHCNSKGCGRWNSSYDLFELDAANALDRINFAPQTDTLNFYLGNSDYTFSPLGFTANTINTTTLNAATVNGHFVGTVAASALPVFNPSGSTHQIGAVPDPGSTPGNTRFLREDGTWSVPAGSATGGAAASTSPIPQPVSNVASCAFGLHVEGDSNSVSGYGTVAAQGWGAQLDADCGLVPSSTVAANQLAVWQLAQGGNQMADVSWKVFTNENPGDFGNPLVTMLDVGGNNSTYDPIDTIGFEQDAYAALTWPAISSTNKVVLGTNAGVSFTGNCTVDGTFANVKGLTCSAGAVVSWTASVGPQGVAYLYAKSLPSTAGAGTFNLASGSTVLSDAITSGTTLNPYIPVARWYAGSPNTVCANNLPCGAIAARYAGLSYGQQTFHATVLSGSVTLLAFASPAMNATNQTPTGPRVIMSDVPHRAGYANDTTVVQYDALDLGIAQTLMNDRLNVPYIEFLSVIDTANDYSTTATNSPSCTASNLAGHWNSCGQNHALAAVEAAIGLTPQNPNPYLASATVTGAVNAASSNVGAMSAFAQPAGAGSEQVQGTAAAAVVSAGYQGASGAVAGTLKVLNNSGNGFSCAGTSDGSNYINCNQSAANMFVSGPVSFYGATNLVGGGALNGYSINNPTFYFNGAGNGFTGTKTMGACTVTITSGVITNVSGC